MKDVIAKLSAFFFSLVIAGASGVVAASVLEYELVGLSEELHKNAAGWLGSPPQSAQAMFR